MAADPGGGEGCEALGVDAGGPLSPDRTVLQCCCRRANSRSRGAPWPSLDVGGGIVKRGWLGHPQRSGAATTEGTQVE